MSNHLHIVNQSEGCAFTPAITLDEYLTLVDETGRIVHAGKRGTISAHLAPILDRPISTSTPG